MEMFETKQSISEWLTLVLSFLNIWIDFWASECFRLASIVTIFLMESLNDIHLKMQENEVDSVNPIDILLQNIFQSFEKLIDNAFKAE